MNLEIADPTMTAEDLHNVMCDLYAMFKIDEMEQEVKDIIKNFIPDDVLSEEHINTNSFDMKTILIGLTQLPQPLQEEWDTFWDDLTDKYDYWKFSRLGLLHRNTFQEIRKSYLMFSVGRTIMPEEPPKTFGVLQLLGEKYIDDILLSAPENSYFTIVYENFNGDNEKINVASGEHDLDTVLGKPSSYWVGKTVFDSFYMTPVLEKETHTWKMVPVDLIRSLKINRDMSVWRNEGESDEF